MAAQVTSTYDYFLKTKDSFPTNLGNAKSKLQQAFSLEAKIDFFFMYSCKLHQEKEKAKASSNDYSYSHLVALELGQIIQLSTLTQNDIKTLNKINNSIQRITTDYKTVESHGQKDITQMEKSQQTLVGQVDDFVLVAGSNEFEMDELKLELETIKKYVKIFSKLQEINQKLCEKAQEKMNHISEYVRNAHSNYTSLQIKGQLGEKPKVPTQMISQPVLSTQLKFQGDPRKKILDPLKKQNNLIELKQIFESLIPNFVNNIERLAAFKEKAYVYQTLNECINKDFEKKYPVLLEEVYTFYTHKTDELNEITNYVEQLLRQCKQFKVFLNDPNQPNYYNVCLDIESLSYLQHVIKIINDSYAKNYSETVSMVPYYHRLKEGLFNLSSSIYSTGSSLFSSISTGFGSASAE